MASIAPAEVAWPTGRAQRSERAEAAATAGLAPALMLVVLLLHPIVSLLILGVVNVFARVSRVVVGVWLAAFTVLIVARQYGVSWSEESDDDAPIYFELIGRLVGRPLQAVLFDPDLALDMEPFPKVFWWAVHGVTGSLSLTVFLQCLLWAWALWHLSSTVSRRFAVVVLITGCLLAPSLVTYEFLHLYRSAWACCFVALALAAQLRRSRLAYAWAALAVLSHASAIIFVVALIAGQLWADGRVRRVHLVVGAVVMAAAFSFGGAQLQDSLFLAKLAGYVASDAPDRAMRIAKAAVFGAGMVGLYRISARGAAQRTAVLCAALVVLTAFEPTLNAISDRLLTLYVPVLLIALAPVLRPRLLVALLVVASLRALELLSPASLLRFAEGAFAELRVPLADFAWFIVHGSRLFPS
ncbi:MAG: EpsG family protein [Pseudomonadota bacterium]|nr:EpsG family protein [Pseudomonadota bacterium]